MKYQINNVVKDADLMTRPIYIYKRPYYIGLGLGVNDVFFNVN